MNSKGKITLFLGLLLATALSVADFKIGVGRIVFYPPELLIYLVFIWVLSQPELKRRLFERWHSLDVPVQQAIYLIIVGSLIATLISPIFPQSIGALKAWVIAPLLLGWLAISFLERTRPVLFAISFFGVALLIRAAAEYYQFGYVERLSGFYESPNYFSALAAPIAVIAFWSSRKVKPYVFIPLGLLLVIVIVLTKSLGGLLGVLVAAVVAWFYLDKKTRIIVLVASALLIVALIPMAYHRFSTQDNSLDSRIQIWKASAQMISDVPFSGMGLRGFEVRFPRYIVEVASSPLQWDAAQPHNLFLALWLGLGMLGLLGFFKLLWHILRWTSEPTAFQLGLIALLGHGLIDTPYFRTDLSIVFWLYISAVLITKPYQVMKNEANS